MKIGYVGGFWATNIGNSFYDLGALALLENIYGKENVFFIPDIANWFWNTDKNYEPLLDVKLDMCLFGGPLLGKGIKNYRVIFESLIRNGSKIGFISAGAARYSVEEKEEVVSFLEDYKEHIRLISTRDTETYQLYKHFGCPVHNGLCTSMFLNDAITLPTLNRKYAVFNFSILKEPLIRFNGDTIRISKRNSLFGFQKTFEEIDIIRTNHNPFTRFKWLLFNRPNMYYSDIPYGYLSIYKNADYVFSDRVHTCAATLILGGTAMYIKGSKRSHDGRNNLFKRIGADTIYEKPTKLNFDYINEEKQHMTQFIKANLEQIQ